MTRQMLFSGLALIALTGCARSPLDYVPIRDRVFIEFGDSGRSTAVQPQAKLQAEDVLRRARGQTESASFVVRFKPGSSEIEPAQQGALVNFAEKAASGLEVVVGPTEGDKISGLLAANRRAETLRKLFEKADIRFDPKQERDTAIVKVRT